MRSRVRACSLAQVAHRDLLVDEPHGVLLDFALLIDEITEIQTLFAESIAAQDTKVVTIGEGDEAFPLTIWSLRCDKRMRFEPPAFNFAFIAGDSRSVIPDP